MAVFSKVNHPGIYFSGLWIVIVAISIMLVQQISRNDTIAPDGYVCPPCGCRMHQGQVFESPGQCPSCFMQLIKKNRSRIVFFERLYGMERSISFYHFKLFYPAYFLAIFVGILSFFKDRRIMPMMLFHVFFLSYVLYAFKHQLSGTSYSLQAPARWQFFPVAFLLLASPALYLYIQQWLDKKKALARKDYLHFLPGSIVILGYSLFFLGIKSWRDWALYNGFDHYLGVAEQFTFILSGTYYLIFSRRIILQNEEAEKSVKVWLMGLLWVQLIIIIAWVLMLTSNLFLFSMMSTSLDYHLIWTLMAVFSLGGAYIILFKKEWIYANAYKKESRLSKDESEILKAKLTHIMQTEKPYLQPDLNLQMLASKMDIKEKELSALLNNGFGCSFYAFINQYRLEEVKKMLLDPQNQHFTNFAIAQQAGFSSKSTFFDLFKKQMGMTPGAFKKKTSPN